MGRSTVGRAVLHQLQVYSITSSISYLELLLQKFFELRLRVLTALKKEKGLK